MNYHTLSVVADQNMPMVDEMFAGFASITKVDGRTLTNAQLATADILLVRSVTQVNEALLNNTPVKFVGSATIGTDHVDLSYLKNNDIAFSSAPGCNADAVVEYDISCLYQLLAQQGETLQDKCVAIIGVGNVGQRLATRLTAIGVKELLLNDPPRAISETGFVSLHECLERADIIAMHTPLTIDGAWPTLHLLAEAELQKLKPNTILINAGRGAAISGEALQKVLAVRDDLQVVLDVWENEPLVINELAEKVKIATPHIAGHSLEGKIRGTFMLKQAVTGWLGGQSADSLDDYLPKADIQAISVTSAINPLAVINISYDPYRDDRALRATLKQEDQAQAFDALRKNYPVRREFYNLQIQGDLSQAKTAQLAALGFKLK